MEIRYTRPPVTTLVHFGADLFPRVAARLRERGDGRRLACITDDRVGPLHAPALLESLRGEGLDAELIEVPAGEASKCRAEKARIEDRLLALGFGRDSRILALGGGVVGDLAGFVAATFMRGIPFWQIPTTIIAMVDSSVGGKTAIDVAAGKNLVGAFHQPQEVFVDPALLRTLPPRELRAGLVEVVKHALIRDAGLFALLEASLEALLEPAAHMDLALRVVRRNIEIKAEVVSEDEREGGARAMLNYGHTLGHALELLSGFRLLHGEAVAVGIAFAGELAVRHGLLDRDDAERQDRLLRKLGVPTRRREDPRRVMEALRLDKKARGGSPRFVLLERIGRVAWLDAGPARPIETGALRDCLEVFLASGEG